MRQRDLAGKLRVSPNYLSMLEADRRLPSIGFLETCIEASGSSGAISLVDGGGQVEPSEEAGRTGERVAHSNSGNLSRGREQRKRGCSVRELISTKSELAEILDVHARRDRHLVSRLDRFYRIKNRAKTERRIQKRSTSRRGDFGKLKTKSSSGC